MADVLVCPENNEVLKRALVRKWCEVTALLGRCVREDDPARFALLDCLFHVLGEFVEPPFEARIETLRHRFDGLYRGAEYWPALEEAFDIVEGYVTTGEVDFELPDFIGDDADMGFPELS